MLKFIRNYIATVRIPYAVYMKALQDGVIVTGARLGPDRVFTYKKSFEYRDRKKATYGICQWYWECMKGAWGQASDIMTISDSFEEVNYGSKFSCADRKNNYLDADTIARVIEQSNGELAIDDREGTKHHPKNSLKRIKRRRVYPERVLDNLYMHPNTGVYYYRHTVVPQWSEEGTHGKPGKILQKRKVENFKLASRDTTKAVKEVERRFGIKLKETI